MNCPTCGGALRQAKYGAMLFPRCFACAACWFKAGLLKGCADLMAKDPATPAAELAIGRAPAAATRVQEPVLACPACSRPMDKLNYGYDSNVIVDHCGPCDGTWVDDAEMRRIAIYTKGNPALDRLGAAFVEEVGKPKEESEKARFLFSMINPLSWAQNIPYKTSVPVLLRPYAVSALIAMNTLVYFLLEPGRRGGAARFLRLWALIPAMVADGHNFHGFVTSMFLHAGLMHLLGNMYFLWLFGRNVESALDHADFVVLYMVAGFSSGVMQVMLDPQSAIPLIGASGAISGVLGAFMRLYPDSKVEVWVWRGNVRIFSARFYLGAWFALQAWSLFKDAALGSFSGVAFAAHIGGFLAGYALTPSPARTVAAA